MIKINLFPYRAARIKENIRRQVTIYFLSVIFFILVFSFYTLNFSQEIKSLRYDIETSEKELASFKYANAKIKELKKTIKDVEIKLKTIQKLEKGKTGPVRLLDEVSQSVPKERLWLSMLRENKGILELKGTAMDNETIAEFMNRLDKTESLSAVKLETAKIHKIIGFDLNFKEFVLKCKTSNFVEKKPVDSKKKRRRR